ncbi:DUF6230 family protein [Agromyces seonyuensis]|uniref:Cholesterol esterase n=1 Tax=Agromyces seonyuensis TaxID=2662446 RepID=A0A6I4P5D2_9MICO|nr:DUF6230 family protein [Agromyces seonyuensis]MWB99629.1 cholesterol esterase [Agromyces seonyuensis]
MKLSSITRSRAGRVALAAVPVGIAASLLLGGVAQGAVPVSFAVSGKAFKIAADDLSGTGFSQYAGVAVDASGKQNPVAISNIADASLKNLCQSVDVLGPIGLRIEAGQGEKTVTAKDLQIAMTDLKGDAEFGNIRIGIDASQVSGTHKGTAGEFAQDAQTVKITGLQQTSYSTTAGTFNLAGLHLAVVTDGTAACFK